MYFILREPLNNSQIVIPAKAGIQKVKALDTGFRQCDGISGVSLTFSAKVQAGTPKVCRPEERSLNAAW
jgi:hypothetical protein